MRLAPRMTVASWILLYALAFYSAVMAIWNQRDLARLQTTAESELKAKKNILAGIQAQLALCEQKRAALEHAARLDQHREGWRSMGSCLDYVDSSGAAVESNVGYGARPHYIPRRDLPAPPPPGGPNTPRASAPAYDTDLQDEVVADLCTLQGVSRKDAITAFRAAYTSGRSYSDVYADALRHIKSRHAGNGAAQQVPPHGNSIAPQPSASAAGQPSTATRAMVGAVARPNHRRRKQSGDASGNTAPAPAVHPDQAGSTPARRSKPSPPAGACCLPGWLRFDKPRSLSAQERSANIVDVSELQLDRVWTSLSVEQKARLIFGENKA